MSTVVILEIVGFWIVLWYNNMRDVYIVNLIISLSLVLYLVNVNGWLSMMLLMMMIPLMGSYMRMLTSLMGGIHLNESVNKLLVLLVVVILSGIVLEWGYVTAFIYFSGGVIGAIVLSVYVFLIMSGSIWILIWSYVVLGSYIGDNYKILGIGILPLIVFFVKICGSYVLLWMVILYSMYNLL